MRKEAEKINALTEVLEICRDNGITVEDLLETIESAVGNKSEEDKLEKKVSNILKEIGVPAHIKGYRYIRYAIIYVLEENDTAIESVTKRLYPSVAKHFDTTASRVERAMRHAIEVAWERGNVDILHNFFGYTIQPGKGKPTNSEFIAMITDYLKIN